jgi:hypothetical protein
MQGHDSMTSLLEHPLASVKPAATAIAASPSLPPIDQHTAEIIPFLTDALTQEITSPSVTSSRAKRSAAAAGLNDRTAAAAPARPFADPQLNASTVAESQARIRELEAIIEQDDVLCWTRNWPCVRCDNVGDLDLPARPAVAAHQRRMNVGVVGPLHAVVGTATIDGRSLEHMSEAANLGALGSARREERLNEIIDPWLADPLHKASLVNDEILIAETSAIPFLLTHLHSDKFVVTMISTATLEAALMAVPEGGLDEVPHDQSDPTFEMIDVLLFSSVLQLTKETCTTPQW